MSTDNTTATATTTPTLADLFHTAASNEPEQTELPEGLTWLRDA